MRLDWNVSQLSDPLISAFIAHLRVEKGRSEHTCTAYRRDLLRFTQFLSESGVDVLRAGSSDVTRFIADRFQSGEADTSVNRALSSVRGFYRWCEAEGFVTDDPCRQVASPRLTRALPKAVSVNEVFRLIEGAGGRGSAELDARDRAFLEFLYATGARVSEATSADIDDVDHDDASVVLRGKGGKQRRVPIGSAARTALDEWLVRGRPALVSAGRGTPALFVNSRGGRLTRQSGFGIGTNPAFR